MKLTHYMTCNIGRGTMSLFRVEDEEGRGMLRVSPNAKVNKVARVSENDMQAALDREQLRDVEHNMTREIAASVETAILQWLTNQKNRDAAIRWEKNEGKLFRTIGDAKEWDATRDVAELDDLLSSAPRKKRFMLG